MRIYNTHACADQKSIKDYQLSSLKGVFRQNEKSLDAFEKTLIAICQTLRTSREIHSDFPNRLLDTKHHSFHTILTSNKSSCRF